MNFESWRGIVGSGIQLDLGADKTVSIGTNPNTGQYQIDYQTGSASRALQNATGSPTSAANALTAPLLGAWKSLLLVGVIVLLAVIGLSRRHSGGG